MLAKLDMFGDTKQANLEILINNLEEGIVCVRNPNRNLMKIEVFRCFL